MNEKEYLMWVLRNNIPQSDDYDMRGFYRGLMSGDPRAISSINPNDNRPHFPDFWKLPNHPTFSTESQYHDKQKMPDTPSWEGGVLRDVLNRIIGDSYSLRRPSGEIVNTDWPWSRQRVGGLPDLLPYAKRGLLDD